MKNFAKIIALAVIAALAAISCAPEVTVTEIDWGQVGAQWDVNQNSTQEGSTTYTPSFSFKKFTSQPEGGNNTYKDPVIDISFPKQADALRAGGVAEIEVALKKFLTFHTFTKAPGDTADDKAGKADVLSAEIPYTVELRNAQTVTVKLTKDFVTGGDGYSNVVAKINAKEYTYAHGLKVDGDNNGVPGEDADELYSEVSITSPTITGFVAPGQKGWYFTIGNITNQNPHFDDKSTVSDEISEVTAASLTANSPYTNGPNNAIKNAILSSFGAQFFLQKYDNGAWTDVTASKYVAPETDSGPGKIVFASVKVEHLKPYRIIWKGAANNVTAAEYYGVNQRIEIQGKEGNKRNKYAYAQTEVIGADNADDVWFNSNLINFDAGNNTLNGGPTLVSADSLERNVVFKIEFSSVTDSSDPSKRYWLDDSLSEAVFKENLKIYTSQSDDFWGADDLILIPYTYTLESDATVQGLSEAEIKDLETSKGKNVLIITLDPAYKKNTNIKKWFYYGNKFGFKDGKTFFGSNDYKHGFFAADNPTLAF